MTSRDIASSGGTDSKTARKVRFEASSLATHLEGDENDDGLSRKEKLQALIKKKKECDGLAKKIVLQLIETGIEKSYLLGNAWRLGQPHWEDIVEERKLSKICGWVLCDAPLGDLPKQQYVIRGKRVLDITERKNFCSSHCYAVSDHFKNQLLDSPLWMRSDEVVPQFEIMEDKSVELNGIVLEFNNLKLDDVDADEEEKGSASEEEEEEH